MARLHVSTGESKTLVKDGERPVFIKNIVVFTDHTNDASIQINDKNGPFFAQPFPVPGETGHGGVVTINEPVYGPATVSVLGTGASATVFYQDIR
jgi:hypothetical protein